MRHWIATHPVTARWLLAGPGALVTAVLVMAGMPVWLPAGSAGVNDVAIPMVLAPLLWAVTFTYAVIEQNLERAAGVLGGAAIVSGLMVAVALAGG